MTTGGSIWLLQFGVHPELKALPPRAAPPSPQLAVSLGPAVAAAHSAWPAQQRITVHGHLQLVRQKGSWGRQNAAIHIAVVSRDISSSSRQQQTGGMAVPALCFAFSSPHTRSFPTPSGTVLRLHVSMERARRRPATAVFLSLKFG